MLSIKTVAVIGANGTMGCNVSAIFASFGNARVYMVSRNIEDSRKAVVKAAKSVRAGSIVANLIPADYSELEKCVSESDLIFESVKEDLKIKTDILKRVSVCLKPDAIVCSGTSGLSITTLSECFEKKDRERCFGVHMFNPPYNLTLCELIPTKYCNKQIYEQLKDYLKNTLRRTVVEVKDSPAFLGNRIGFQFINEAMQYAEKYADNGGIDYIDSILGSYTGRAMAPLTTADFVGLDVHKAIVDNVYENTCDYAHETFMLPEFCQKLIDEGKLGRKNGCGFYKLIRYDNGLKRMMVYDISSNTYREKMDYVFPFAEKMLHDINKGSYQAAFKALIDNHSLEATITIEFLLKYVMYSVMAAESVGFDIHSADDVMATGFNWCPPLAVADAFSTVCDFKKLVKMYLSEKEMFKNIDLDHLLSLIKPSKYDYRVYFRAKK